MRIILDAKQLERRQEAHAYLKKQLSLPEYYGNNLDALYDCLTSLPPATVCFIHEDQVSGGYFEKIRRVFRDSRRENPNLEIVSEKDQEEDVIPDSDGGKNAARENAADKNAPAETAAVPGFQEKDRTWN